MRKLRVSFAAVALAALAFAGAARADSPEDAWNTAKGIVPANTQVLIGLNIATIKGSTLFQQLYTQMLAQAGDAKDDLENLKAQCGFDLKDALQGVVVALDESQKGAVYVSLKGINQGNALECMNKMGKKENKSFTASKPDAQGIVEYTESGKKEKVYVAWLPKGVVAISTEQDDKAMLQKFLNGKGVDPKSSAQSAVGKVKTSAALWGVVAKAQQIDQGMNMKVGYGHADIGGGNITADLRVQLANAKEATDAAAKGNQQLEEAKKSQGLPPALVAVMKSVKIGSAGDEVTVKAQMAEKEALALLSMAMGGGH